MGTHGKKIVDLNLKDLISLLNKALADEWLAYYQYWIGSKVVKGPMAERIKVELEEHAGEELKHANMLTERILQLGGTPVLEYKDLEKLSTCGFSAPKNPDGKAVLRQNIKGEQCAIAVYVKLLKLTEGKDILTHLMLQEILKEEVEHEDDLENILEDLS